MRTGSAISGKAQRKAWDKNCMRYLAEALLRRR
jgi:hypothetical protein